jgi:hypothetical protein
MRGPALVVHRELEDIFHPEDRSQAAPEAVLDLANDAPHAPGVDVAVFGALGVEDDLGELRTRLRRTPIASGP